MPSEEGPPTLATVAASAGVSIATVSKVLNGRADVGPETRARVQTLLQQHDYVGRRGESAGRALAEQPTVELVLHGRMSVYFMEILQGVLDAERSPASPSRQRPPPAAGNAPPGSGPPPGFANWSSSAGRP